MQAHLRLLAAPALALVLTALLAAQSDAQSDAPRASAPAGVPSRLQLAREMAKGVPPAGAVAEWREGQRPDDALAAALRDQAVRGWREEMTQLPAPEAGCFVADYPDLAWHKVACVPAPDIPMVPQTGPRPFVVGNTNDVSARVPTAGALISSAIGSFDSDAGVTSVSSPIGNSGSPVANAYTLQLNSNFFASTACAGSPNPNCRGWEQFVFGNNGSSGIAFIQYWLLRYNTTCPATWTQFSFTGSTDIYCFRNNGGGATPTANQPITDLDQMSVTATATATADSMTFAKGTTVAMVTGDNSVALSTGWDTAEFGVFAFGGNSGGGGGATFNAGSTVVPRARIFYGGTAAPTCVAAGFTGETNNLSFGPTAPAATGPGPAVFSTQTNGGGATSNCAAATSIGDTHLTTFGGMLYDFQASGDFVLAEIRPGFEVQARQVSGRPTWPDAAVNSAVALRSGKTVAALCLNPARLVVDGAQFQPADQEYLAFPDGVDALRLGDVWFIRTADGNSVRAVMHPDYMNVSVGLGQWPVDVHGLLFNTQRFHLQTRNGETLSTPMPFKALYDVYGESWRVRPEDSLIAACGDKEVEQGRPERPFFADALDDATRKTALAVCRERGVTEPALLDACAIDVAVIGDKAAAEAFAGMAAPVVVMRPLP